MKKITFFKEIKNKAKLVGAGAAVVSATLTSGCNPTNVENPPVNNEVQTPVTDPEVTVEPEVIVEPETDPEVTVEPEVVEESNDPELVLYDADGNFYVPQDVKLDEFYSRIDYANEKYEWKSDWDRDRYVGLLLYNNAYAMDDADIKTVYEDYLDNFGIDVLDGQFECSFNIQEGHTPDEYYYDHNLIDLEDLFIDAKFANEAKKFQPIIQDNKVMADFVDKKNEFAESLDYSDKNMYNILFEQEMKYLMYSFGSKTVDGMFDNSHVINESKLKVWDQISIDDEMLKGYNISGYESSHVEMTK